MIKYIIIGAGPAGLTFANSLLEKGIKSFIVLEKESSAGGLCRSELVDGFPLDIGGGHFLDVRRPKVNEFLFRFMPENEWNLFTRDSRISLPFGEINHPFEANIWQFPQSKQIEYLKSIAIAPCNLGMKIPETFIEWIEWKLGRKISEDYMIPYNKKIFGENLNQLGTYWLEKLPNVSFDETLLSCLNRKPYGTQPGHAKFLYPKNSGYGELWLRMADNLGEKIKYNSLVKELDFDTTSIILDDHTILQAEYIINTVPWTCLRFKGIPEQIKKYISELKYTSVYITYKSNNLNTKAHWIYYPDLSLDYHRILVRSNFCLGSKGYWTETNSNRYKKTKDLSFFNEYAYPLNTITKPENIKKILNFSKTKNIVGLGRWGEWEHYNSDVTVLKAMELVNSF